MKKIIDYDILEENNPNKLVDKVKEKIKEGFEPYGFMEAKGEYQHAYYMQAVVKYEYVTMPKQ